MKKRPIFIGLAILAIAVVVGLVYRLLVPPTVQVAEARHRDVVETLVATGQVSPIEQPALTARVSAPVEDVEIQPGDEVRAGAVVARLDDTRARLEVDQAAAGVEEARAGLNSVTDQGAPTALENLEQAMFELEAAREEYDRARQLYEQGVGTRRAVDEARRSVQRAESEAQRARTNYREAGREGSEYARAAAALARARAQHRIARRRLDDYTIRAPTDGTVLSREVDPGDTVQPGTVIAALAPDRPPEIRINPDERELSNLEVGQSAVAVTDAYPNRPFEATVHRISPAVDPERGTIAVDLRTKEAVDFLRPAMTATVDIELDRRDDALVVPRAAVRDLETGTPWVLRIDGGRAVGTEVEVGLSNDRRVEITAGVAAGTPVVVGPDAEPGDRVRPGDEFEPADDASGPGRVPEDEPTEPPTARLED